MMANAETSFSLARKAAGSDDVEALASLVEGWSATELDACRDGSGKGLLHHAAWQGSSGCVKLLLDRGASVDAVANGQFTHGKSPIFFAITRSRDATVLQLLAAGCSCRIVNNKGQSPRSLAESHLEPSTCEALAAAEAAEGDAPWVRV